MARSIVVALLLLLTSGCARSKPDTPVPEPKATATRPATPRAPARPVAPTVAGRGAAPVARSTTAAPPLDLKVLTQRLRETKAIGLFTKITLKNQVDDLLDGFREYYQGGSKLAIADLRRSFDLLLMKVLSLLQDDDQTLASAIVYSREAIWRVLADPKKFATLDA